MRRVLCLAPLFAVLACNEGAPSGSGFASGEVGGQGTSGAADTSGTSGAADGGSAATGGSSGASTSAGETSGAGEESGSSDTAGDETTAGGSSGDSSGGDSSGGESSGDSGVVPVGDDACGFPLDGPWIEIEYNQAGGTATSPSWSYSDTPGWGEAQWAASNASWPEVWDLYQNINVSNDPIGVLAVVGSSAQLQLMLGFEELIDYDYATVCVEGRSVSTSASVQFDAYNPLTGIGNSGSMAHDWNMHATGLDLGQCFEPGGGVQAVRLDATGGSASLGVKRMRLVLHGAVY